MKATLLDARRAQSRSRWRNAFQWRCFDRRPAHLGRFEAVLLAEAESGGFQLLLSTGLCPISAQALSRLGALGIRRLHFSTDDPWNPSQRTSWFLRSLPHYDIVFSPRAANVPDFRALGCREVVRLPFGFDEELFPSGWTLSSESGDKQGASPLPTPDLLFVGGADGDRRAFLAPVLTTGLRIALVGDYWQRSEPFRSHSLGHLPPEQVRDLTRRAAINLILVRRANRDGHVMRSLEAAAAGGCLLVEDTADHRELFGEEGDCVLFFSTPEDCLTKARWLLAHPAESRRLAHEAQSRINVCGHGYEQRLRAILAREGHPFPDRT